MLRQKQGREPAGRNRSPWLLLPPRLGLHRKILERVDEIHHGTVTPNQALCRYHHGTTERENKRRTAPKRHQIKHLEFYTFIARDQGLEVQILSPRPIISFLRFRDLRTNPSFTFETKARSRAVIPFVDN